MGLFVTMKDQAKIREWAAPIMRVDALASDMILIGVYRNDEIIAAVGLNAFYSDQAAMHVASNGKRAWINRMVLRCIFGYAFGYRGIRRLNLIVPTWNRNAQILAVKCGGIPEGYLRSASVDGSDAVLFGLLREDCPFVPNSNKEIRDGEERRT